VVETQFVGMVHILLGLAALFFLQPAYDNSDNPGSLSFAVLCVGVTLYGIGAGLDLFVPDYGLSVWLLTVRSLGGVLITTAWLVLALEVTGWVTVTRRLRVVFAGYVVLAQSFIWAHPVHDLFVGSNSPMDGANLDPDIQAGLWAILGVGYLASFAGTGLLASDALRSTGIRRKQRMTLALGFVPALLGSLVTVSGVTTYDYTVPGYALTALLFAWALFGGRFLDLAPVARRTALGEMSDAVVTLDDRGWVVDCNRRARELFDVDDYAGLPAADVFPSVVNEVTASEGTGTETEVAIGVGDRQRHFSVSVSPVEDHTREGRVVVLHDITDRKRRERDLRRQNERLDQFTSVVSHDLRNPLNVASGRLALVVEECDCEGTDPHFDSIERSHDRMEAMIDDLLAVARAGRSVEETEQSVLADLAREAWAHADTGDCDLDVAVPATATVSANPNGLLHVFENCFRNAIDHNDTAVTVRVGSLDGDGTGGQGGFFIEDDGRGIPETERDSVFEHGYTTSDDGIGFGLSIVRDIVEAHGWTIRATEGTSGGARFEVTGVDVDERTDPPAASERPEND